ncbi:MAG: hypothetical protein ABI533_06435 [Betaproteobacteria bacterium]
MRTRTFSMHKLVIFMVAGTLSLNAWSQPAPVPATSSTSTVSSVPADKVDKAADRVNATDPAAPVAKPRKKARKSLVKLGPPARAGQ